MGNSTTVFSAVRPSRIQIPRFSGGPGERDSCCPGGVDAESGSAGPHRLRMEPGLPDHRSESPGPRSPPPAIRDDQRRNHYSRCAARLVYIGAQVALAWVLSQHRASLVKRRFTIPRAGTLSHVRQNAAARDIELTRTTSTTSTKPFPPPTRPCPLEALQTTRRTTTATARRVYPSWCRPPAGGYRRSTAPARLPEDADLPRFQCVPG